MSKLLGSAPWFGPAKLMLGLVVFLALFIIGQPSQPASGVSAAFPTGQHSTVIAVQNRGSSAATVGSRYFNSDGSEVTAAAEVRAVGGGGSTSFRQATNAKLPHGFLGSAVVSSDKTLATVNLRNINDAENLALGAANGSPTGYALVAFPIVYKGAASGWNTRLIIQNVSDTTGCLRLIFIDRSGDRTDVFDGASGPCPGGGTVLPAFSTHVVQPSDMPVGEGFIGAVRADTFSNSQAEVAMLAGSADFWGPSRRFASYKGAGLANKTSLGSDDDIGFGVYVPEIMREAGGAGDWYTHMHVYNISPGTQANVTVRYRGTGLPGGEVSETLQVDGVVDIYHNSEDLLPPGFHGSAYITADRKIAVAAGRGKAGTQIFGGYLGAAAQASGTQWYLPLLYRRYASGGSDSGWNSWFRVQAKDGGTAQVTITMFPQPDDPYGCTSGSSTATFAVTGDQTFFLWRGDGWPEGDAPNCYGGGAKLTADKSVVVMGNVTAAKAYTADLEATYNGAR